MKIILAEKVEGMRTSGVMYGYNLALDDVLSTAVEITQEDIHRSLVKAKLLSDKSDRDRAYGKAILKLLEGKGGGE